MGAGVVAAGAGDDENQRCGAFLPGQAIAQRLHRPEIVRQLGFPLRAQFEVVVGLVDVFVPRHLAAQVRRCGGDGRLEGVGDRKTVGVRVEVRGQYLGTEDQAAQQGSESKAEHRMVPVQILLRPGSALAAGSSHSPGASGPRSL
ncbi:hypothetical protein D3C78_1424270 [compost metagenome]